MTQTYPLDFHAEILQFAAQAMVRLVQLGGLRLRRLQQSLCLVQLDRQLPLEFIESLRADAALAALALLSPGCRLVVRLGDEALHVGAPSLLLLQLISQSIKVSL